MVCTTNTKECFACSRVTKMVCVSCLALHLQEYEVYLRVVYVHVALVAILVGGFVGLFIATARKVEFSKRARKAIKVLHVSR